MLVKDHEGRRVREDYDLSLWVSVISIWACLRRRLARVDLSVITGRTLRLDFGVNADVTGTEVLSDLAARCTELTARFRDPGGTSSWPVVRTTDRIVPASVSPSDALAPERRKHVGQGFARLSEDV